MTVPSSWIYAQLGVVANVQMGQSPDSSTYNETKQGLPFFQGKTEFGKRSPTARKWCTSPAKVAEPGDILLSIRAPVGPLNVADVQCVIGRGLAAIAPLAGVNGDYLVHALRHLEPQLARKATGTTFPAVGGDVVRALAVPLAPEREQKRIADKLDTVLTRVDAVNTRLARVVPLIKRFRQSVLAAATSGRLTEDWRVVNQPTSAQVKGQLDTITQARLQRMKKEKEAVERTKSEEFDIPKSWLWTSLDALTAKIVDGTHHTPTYVDQGIPFVSVKDIRDGVIDFSSTKFIAEAEHRELSKRCPVERGDLLITKSGTIGRTAIVKTDTPFSLFVSVALLKPASNAVNMRFIDLVLQHWIGSIDVASRIVGSTIKNLHLVDMKVLGIPFPCLNEQTEIVRRVETLFAFADRLEARLQTAQTAAHRFTPALLAKAFSGELVPQDPNDEPASELLKRLAMNTLLTAKRSRKPRESSVKHV